METIKLPRHPGSILQQLSGLRADMTLCDVLLKAKDGKVCAHRLVLMAASPFFQANLSKSLKTSVQEIHFENVPKRVVEAVIKFIYSGELTVKKEDLHTALRVCEEVELSDVVHAWKSLKGPKVAVGMAQEEVDSDGEEMDDVKQEADDFSPEVDNDLDYLDDEDVGALEEVGLHEQEDGTEVAGEQLRVVQKLETVGEGGMDPTPWSGVKMKGNKRQVEGAEYCEGQNESIVGETADEADPGPYNCALCEASIEDRTLFSHHMVQHTGDMNQNKCYKCGKRCIIDAFDLTSHLKKHKVSMHPCKTCGKIFTYLKALEDHENMHAGVQPYKCTLCSKTFTRESNLQQHMRAHLKPHKCTLCGKAFGNMQGLQVHWRRHTGDNPYPCTVCDKAFAYAQALKLHMITHEENRPKKTFTCDVCEKKFNSRSNKAEHMLIHKGVKNHVCDECGKAFLTPSGLRKHIRSHSGVRPHKCVHCGRLFTRKHHLTDHERSHTGEQFSCTVCNKGFNTAPALTKHMRMHTGERPYVCEVCGKGFKTRSNINAHMKLHKAKQQT